jgi:hypothetical protein
MHVFTYSVANLSFYMFFDYKCNIYIKNIYIYIYIYIIDAFETLRFQGFLENDASDALASCNTAYSKV